MADIITRFKRAVDAFRSGGAPRGRTAYKAAPFLWPSWIDGEPVWHMDDYSSYVREGFQLNSLIYSAVMYKYRALTSSPLRAYTNDPDSRQRLPAEHPLSKLLMRPNPHQSIVEFLGQQDTYLNLSGNAYIFIDRGKSLPPNKPLDAPPVALWNLRPDRVHIVPGSGSLKGFMYRPEGKSLREAFPILPSDMIHIKLPNPLDPYEGMGYGLSPIAAMAQIADSDNSITAFIKQLFDNKTMLGGVLQFNMPLDDEAVSSARERWQDIYGGVDNWGAIAVLDNGGKFEQFSPDFAKLDFRNIDSRNEKRSMGPLGVPGMLIGITMENSTFSNFEQADRVFWQNTFIPEQTLFEVDYQHYLSTPDAIPAYDRSNVAALQGNVTEKIDGAHKLWQMGVPRVNAFAVVGLNVPASDGDDRSYVSASTIPAEQAGRQPSPAKGSDLPPLQRKGWTDEQKVQHWKAVDSLAQAHESAFEVGATSAFEADKRAILVLLGKAKEKAKARKATIDWLEIEGDIKAYLEKEGAANWQSVFVPLLTAEVRDVGNYWSAQFGIAFNIRNLLGEAWFADYLLQFAQPINETTLEGIHDVLAQAQKEGWSIETMQRNMETLFTQWMQGDLSAEDFAWLAQRLPPHRTELIARTETTRIQNAGSWELFKQWGVKQKEWQATGDGRTRDSHAAAGSQVVDIDKPFKVNGYNMQHPGDSSGGAPISEIANCRCAVLPVIED